EVIAQITIVAIALTVYYEVDERERNADGIESGIHGEIARTLQATEQREFEVTHNNRPLLWRFGQESQSKALADIVVAKGAVKFGMEVVLRGIGKVDRSRDIDGLGVRIVRQEVKVVRKSFA